MHLDRRSLLRGLCAGGLYAGGLTVALPRSGIADTTGLARHAPRTWQHFELANGLRVHALANDTGYVSGALLLRSNKITFEDGGLAHLMEHTSFTGAAGDYSAAELKSLHKDIFQEANASTSHGAIEWQVSFLPDQLEQALRVLSVTSLDQKFDEETVASEAKVVLQELYLDKYAKTEECHKRFERALYGSSHPFALDTVGKEIETANTPPAKLAAQLRRYAESIRLPANMDLFLAGDLDFAVLEAAARTSFGAYPHASGPMLEMPPVDATRGYERLVGPSHDLSRPMCELVIAWNTGVSIRDGNARVLMALSEYLSGILFLHLRENHGEAYTPTIAYEPDSSSGVITITVTSSVNPARVEQSVFDALERAKQDVDAREIARFTSRAKLKRLRGGNDNAALVKSAVEATIDGASANDLAIETVTVDEILAAARHYLPSKGDGYVRLALRGQ